MFVVDFASGQLSVNASLDYESAALFILELAVTDAGAETLILERAGGAGGTSALSGGVLYLGGGTPVQKACGFEDSPEAMAAFLERACGPAADVEKIERYCRGSVEHFHWLIEQEVPFKHSFYPEPSMEAPTVCMISSMRSKPRRVRHVRIPRRLFC